jgi:hypothetical protein
MSTEVAASLITRVLREFRHKYEGAVARPIKSFNALLGPMRRVGELLAAASKQLQPKTCYNR